MGVSDSNFPDPDQHDLDDIGYLRKRMPLW